MDKVDLNKLFAKHLEDIKNNKYDFSFEEEKAISAFIASVCKDLGVPHDNLQDTMQEMLINFFNKSLKYYNPEKGKITTFMQKCMTNIYFMSLRKAKYKQPFFESSVSSLDDNLIKQNINDQTSYYCEHNFIRSTRSTPHEAYINGYDNEYYKYLNKKICEKPILKMYYVDGLSLEKIGKLINVSLEVVRYKIIRLQYEIKHTLAMENIFSPEEFHSFAEAPSFETDKGEVNPEFKKFIYGKVELYGYIGTRLMNRLTEYEMARLFNIGRTTFQYRCNKEYELLLKDFKNRKLNFPEETLKLALEIIPNKIKLFKTMDDKCFQLIENEIKTNKVLTSKKEKSRDILSKLKYKNELLKICKEVNYLDKQIKANNKAQEKTR